MDSLESICLALQSGTNLIFLNSPFFKKRLPMPSETRGLIQLVAAKPPTPFSASAGHVT